MKKSISTALFVGMPFFFIAGLFLNYLEKTNESDQQLKQEEALRRELEAKVDELEDRAAVLKERVEELEWENFTGGDSDKL